MQIFNWISAFLLVLQTIAVFVSAEIEAMSSTGKEGMSSTGGGGMIIPDDYNETTQRWGFWFGVGLLSFIFVFIITLLFVFLRRFGNKSGSGFHEPLLS